MWTGVGQATAAAQAEAEAFPDKPMHHLPVPVGRSMPASAGSCCTAALNSSRCASPRAGGTTGLLEYQGSGPSLTEGRRPSSDGVRVPFQRRRRGRCPPALGQQQDGVPPLPWRRRQDHPSTQILDFHLSLFQRPVYLPHADHQPSPNPCTPWPSSSTNVSHFSAYFTLALVQDAVSPRDAGRRAVSRSPAAATAVIARTRNAPW